MNAFPAMAVLVTALASAADAPFALRVRASAVVAPCVEAAVRAWPAARGKVDVETASPLAPGPVDVLVASAIELTRALEGGTAEPGTDVDVASVPWVVQVRGAGTASIRRAADLAGSGLEVTVPESPASYEAWRWARSTSGGRVRSASGRALREAAVALVPLSLAAPGDRMGVDVPPIVARAAAGVAPAHPEDAGALVAFLASEPGQKAFAECRVSP
ncbi:MAG TPA: hypothetical protein VMT87_01070 [Vicinamibacteria bacterium]|nr:hypothetical protein [Vicinamibacteria bacterium]